MPLTDIALGVLADAGLKATLGLGLGLVLAGALRTSSASARHAVLACGLATGPLLLIHRAWLATPELGLSLPGSLGAGLLAVWAVGALLAVAPLGRGLVALSSLAARGHREEGLIWSQDLEVPVTFARSIVLPHAAREWPDTQRHAAILHERAHLERGDWWVHVMAWCSCALLWFHPLAWWARAQLMLEAERAADDRVVLAGVQPSAYAQQLLGLVGSPGAGLGLGPSNTAVRVRAILGAPNRSRVRWPAIALAVSLMLAVVGPVTAFAAWTPVDPPHCDPLGEQP